MVAIILQYINALNQHATHLKLTKCYIVKHISIIKKKEEGNLSLTEPIMKRLSND